MILKHDFIIFYSENDDVVCMADTWDELMDVTRKTRNQIQSMITHYFKGVTKSVIIEGIKCKPYLYDLKEVE